ncbi:hypothetical protein F3087_26870 [Nocardia colli]|uniref:XRE family transcriptional regulator n=1 Tax=Nocardia colli TaxID=2545717 RepID=A0A5N0EDC0_9NOCA|nr:hypothetical protein [Nocardia colli]KAA8886214.1 hypothetical protein F3087_26870 [Nocardia colli]
MEVISALVENDLACQLNLLFEQWQRGHGRLLTNREVADLATAEGYPMSASYVSQLRTGARGNPSRTILSGLAHVFHACSDPLRAPSGATTAVGDDQLIGKVADLRLRRLLYSADGLSMAAYDILIAFTDKLRRAECLLVDTPETLAALLQILARTKSGAGRPPLRARRRAAP